MTASHYCWSHRRTVHRLRLDSDKGPTVALVVPMPKAADYRVKCFSERHGEISVGFADTVDEGKRMAERWVETAR